MDLLNWMGARLSERSTWISITGFASMMGIGLNPAVLVAVEQAPVIVGGLWAIAQTVLPDNK